MAKQKFGTVYFVGAGPGDPELLTIKAAKILSTAEVVITDRLVNEEILKEHANPDAIIIPVGKQGGSDASTMQFEINDLIVQFAAAYNIVSSDPTNSDSFFSNSL